jgi:GT2 family glycosyltransferase/glycosyltransferase involved in cell wall biosynthesis
MSAVKTLEEFPNARTTAVRGRSLRILYATGPGDVIGTWEYWRAGEDDPRSTDVGRFAQFYDFCQEVDAQGMVIAQRAQRRKRSSGNLLFLYRAAPWQNSGSATFYHLGQIWNGLRLTYHAVRFKADVMVVSMGTHWFMLTLPAWMGISVVPDLCCTLWPTGRRKRTTVSAIVQMLNASFWRNHVAATLCVSEECQRQVKELSGTPRGPLILHRTLYREEWMSAVESPDHQKRPFTLLFAGRVEANKGVFDLLKVMRKLETARPGVFRCVICGDGSALAAVRREVTRLNLSASIELTGYVERPQMLRKLADAHVAIAPTTATFAEGLNRAVIEGVLVGRPVIATTVCNARDALAPAVIEVNCGDIDAMTDAVLRLESDIAYYREKQAACAALARPFYEEKRSWGAALKRAIEPVMPTPDEKFVPAVRTSAAVAIVIVNYATANLTVDCLHSLAADPSRTDGWQVIVVDNASPDDSASVLGGAIAENNWSHWVQLLRAPGNTGFAAGNNLAFAKILQSPNRPGYVLLLNPDTIVRPQAIDHLIQFMEKHPAAGVAGSRLEDMDGTPQFSAFRFPTLRGELDGGLQLDFVTRLVKPHVIAPPVQSEAHRTDWVAGASMMIRTALLEQLGGLDAAYFLYYEETDFCLQAMRAGWECWYVPESRVVHLVGKSTGVTNVANARRRLPRYWYDSRRRYFQKNHGRLYALLAEVIWQAGHALWRIRSVVQRRTGNTPQARLRDGIRFIVWPLMTGDRSFVEFP